MSLYTTPLQFGYFFSLLMWLIFLFRGYKEQRLSDKLLGWIMFILAMELQDYTFGFAGINVLWNELNGFPRGVSLLFGPVVYFYFRSQIDRSFRLTQQSLWHFVPYIVFFIYHMIFFVQGAEVVELEQSSALHLWLTYLVLVSQWASYFFYLRQCLLIYRQYKLWSLNQFSNEDLISFNWFRNFIYTMIFWLVCREIMNFVDSYLDLTFYQDWWWNLALVLVSFYIGLAGYSQAQPSKLLFKLTNHSIEIDKLSHNENVNHNHSTDQNNKRASLANSITQLMTTHKLFLQPDLNLHELSQRLNVNKVELSAAINNEFNKNFNDYVNSLRIEAFIQLYQQKENKQFTMLSIAYDSGFNSKATFNRAFKKIKGVSPKAYFEQSSISNK